MLGLAWAMMRREEALLASKDPKLHALGERMRDGDVEAYSNAMTSSFEGIGPYNPKKAEYSALLKGVAAAKAELGE